MVHISYPEVTRDKRANAAYMTFKSIGDGEAVETVPVEDKNGNAMLLIDFSSHGQVLGVEFLDAERQLPEDLVLEDLGE